jgi:signal transduction histidine kinase
MSGSGPSPRLPRGSIKARLPLLIVALLTASVVAFGALAYFEVERSFLTASRERVQNVARQLAQLLGQSVQPRLEEVRRLAARPSIRTLLQSSAPAPDAAARAEIAEFLKTSPQTLAVDVWSAAGTRVLGLANAPVAADAAAAVNTSKPVGPGITPLQQYGAVITYDVVGAVTADDAAAGRAGSAPALGYVVIRRRGSTPGAAAMVRQLLGGAMSVQFGTRRGGVWTDLSRATAAPPETALATTGPAEYTDASGVARIGASAGMGGAPWVVWVSTSRSDALAGVRSFLWRLGYVGLATIVIGALAAWWLARRVTAPLVELTQAAEAMAAGNFSRRVPVGPKSEVGRLGHSFNVMAERVEDGYARLDARVQERTRELEATLHTLKETQESLVRREKLAMLGQLASGVGHELRNPLGVMTNAVYYLELVQPDAPEEIRDYHGILKSQIGLAERIVSDLLDFSRIRPPRREEISLARLVDDQLVRLGKFEGVTIAKDVSEDLPSADIDPVQMGQVVLNLLLNGVQAMEERGGVLTIRGRVVDEGVALDVTDTGPGVPPELREKIFEALFTTKARGIGLGLAVSRSLAVANGGALTVSQPAEGGAMFTLVAPAVRVEVTR